MELKLKKCEYNYTGGLVKLNDMQNYIDPNWKKLGIHEYWYHKITLHNNQILYVLDKHYYEIGKGWTQNPPTKLIKHKNGDLTIKFNNLKDSIEIAVLY